MKIIICEDDRAQRQFIQHEISKNTCVHFPGSEVVLAASSGEEVIRYINDAPADCYILDIELEGKMNGLELASGIREKDPLANIIFLTTFADKLALTFTYKVAAMDYIVKSAYKKQLSSKIIEAVKTAYKRYNYLDEKSNPKVLQIKIGGSFKSIKFADIYYFETSSTAHKIKLHSKNVVYEYYGKLKDIEQLDERFCRCHNSYVINIDHLIQFTPKSKSLVMSNEHECLVSFRYAKNIRSKFI